MRLGIALLCLACTACAPYVLKRQPNGELWVSSGAGLTVTDPNKVDAKATEACGAGSKAEFVRTIPSGDAYINVYRCRAVSGDSITF